MLVETHCITLSAFIVSLKFSIISSNIHGESLSYIWPNFLLETLFYNQKGSASDTCSVSEKYKFSRPTANLLDQNPKMRHKKGCFLTASPMHPPRLHPAVEIR